MQKGRVKNVSRNMIFGGILKVYQIITPFIIKSYYVKGSFCHLIHMTAAHLW